jgi:hypothetical protein
MSERYGTPAEVNEMFEFLEDAVRERMDGIVEEEKRVGDGEPPHPYSYNSGYLMALRDVLDWMGVSTK